jgi:hypothetical protein
MCVRSEATCGKVLELTARQILTPLQTEYVIARSWVLYFASHRVVARDMGWLCREKR